MALVRQRLRDQIRDEVVHRIASGELAPGDDINEAELAEDLGVSRTPLREALVSLETSGVLQSQAGKGFQFAPMSPQEFAETIAIVAALEALALRQSDPVELRRLAADLARDAGAIPGDTAQFGELTAYDDAWHAQMLSACRNRKLLELIAVMKLGLHRYERQIVAEDDVVARSVDQHARIAQLLAEGDVEGACDEVRRNWESALAERLTHLEG
jgi:DNA-binding GntR family transcriptional regulator